MGKQWNHISYNSLCELLWSQQDLFTTWSFGCNFILLVFFIPQHNSFASRTSIVMKIVCSLCGSWQQISVHLSQWQSVHILLEKNKGWSIPFRPSQAKVSPCGVTGTSNYKDLQRIFRLLIWSWFVRRSPRSSFGMASNHVFTVNALTVYI